jgi:hypothetical protein
LFFLLEFFPLPPEEVAVEGVPVPPAVGLRPLFPFVSALIIFLKKRRRRRRGRGTVRQTDHKKEINKLQLLPFIQACCGRLKIQTFDAFFFSPFVALLPFFSFSFVFVRFVSLLCLPLLPLCFLSSVA